MTYNDFLIKHEQIKKLSVAEQKKFYEQLLQNKHDKTEIRVLASFYYGQLFYQEGNFRKTIEIMEPIIVDYQSYPYIPKILSCFNLMGVATHCEADYSVSRFFYETALKIAKENQEKYYYAFEYNNIALSYTEEQNYELALENLERAEAVLKDCDEEMGAYIYINKSISLQKLNKLSEALQAFETGVKQYHADEVVPDDVIRCAATLYYKLGQMTEYEKYKRQILLKINDMYAAEFIDACRALFECGLDSDDDKLMNHILHSMSRYMEKYPEEIKVGCIFAEFKYIYVSRKKDKDAILDALELKNTYKDRIIEYSKKNRVKSLKQFMEIHSQIFELERDGLTGFKNRQAYYKDVEMIEQNEYMSQKPVGVVFVDVNGLKKVNDNLGHEAGDALILSVAGKITEVFGDARCYRFGGDELVILSFDKNEDTFYNKLKRLTKLWEANCSASVGSIWLEHANNIEKGVSEADERMYMDKSNYYENKLHDRRANTHIDTESILKKVEAISEFLPGGFFVYRADEKEQLITFNEELIRIYKCRNKEEFIEFTGNSFKGMVHPEDIKMVEGGISNQIKQEKDIDQVQYRIICKDGTVKKVWDYGRFVHTEMYGDVYYVFINDIPDNWLIKS